MFELEVTQLTIANLQLLILRLIMTEHEWEPTLNEDPTKHQALSNPLNFLPLSIKIN